MTRVRRIRAKVAEVSLGLANGLLALVRRLLWPRLRLVRAQRVCLYRIGNLGDILCALPAMHAVRVAYPDAKLTLVTSPGKRGLPGAVELLAGARWIDEFFVYHSEDIRTRSQQLRVLKRLRRKKFDVWIELPASLSTMGALLRNMLAARLCGAGWGYGWRLSTILWAARLDAGRTFPNEVDRLLSLLDRCGIGTRGAHFPLPITEGNVLTVDTLLRETTPHATPLVAIAPGAKRPANRWPVERYAKVGQSLSDRGFFVLLLGGPQDREPCEWIADRMKPHALVLAGRLSVLESCEALRRCAFVICNDSGVQHMAAAVSTPCISIFSDREIRGRWHPYGAQHVVLRRAMSCGRCYLDRCTRDNLCLKLIQISDVLKATEGLSGIHRPRNAAAAEPAPERPSRIALPAI